MFGKRIPASERGNDRCGKRWRCVIAALDAAIL